MSYSVVGALVYVPRKSTETKSYWSQFHDCNTIAQWIWWMSRDETRPGPRKRTAWIKLFPEGYIVLPTRFKMPINHKNKASDICSCFMKVFWDHLIFSAKWKILHRRESRTYPLSKLFTMIHRNGSWWNMPENMLCISNHLTFVGSANLAEDNGN